MIPPDEQDRYHVLSGNPDFFARIKAAEQYASTMLPFIPRGLPVFQSHGINHSLAIIRYINQIIRAPGLQLSSQEIFLLYLAAWFHDLGYLHPLSIHNRNMHPALSTEMIRADQVIQGLINKQEFSVLETIIRYHDSHTDLKSIQEQQSSFRSPLLSALFRIADAVELGTDRCPPEVYALIEGGLDEHSRQHWQAHQNVTGVHVAYPLITILVRDPENPFFRGRIIPHVEEDCRSSGWILKKYGIAPVVLKYRSGEPE